LQQVKIGQRNRNLRLHLLELVFHVENHRLEHLLGILGFIRPYRDRHWGLTNDLIGGLLVSESRYRKTLCCSARSFGFFMIKGCASGSLLT
jgi:hypothetical protein